MKIPGRCGKRKIGPIWALFMVIVLIMLASMVPAWGSSGGGEHGAEGGGGHAAASKPWQVTDTAKVLNFGVLAIGLFLLLRKPVAQTLGARIKGIKEELEDLESRKLQVERQLADYNTKLATLDKEAEQVVAEYIRQGEEAKARILKVAESAAEKLKEQAQKNIQNEFNQAKQSLQAEIVEKALATAEQLIKEKISAEDQDRLVDEYLEKVVA
jgi:F-type H+-transporting ATPase subunit b